MPKKDSKRLLPLFILSDSWLIVLLLLIGLSLSGQAWSTSPRHITVDDGLPTSDTYDIEQDKDGFIWVGTDVGLAKYDGYDFEVFTSRDGLPNNDIIRISEDRRGRLWLSSIGPLCIMDKTDKQIIELPKVRKTRTIFDMISSAEDGMWFNLGTYIFYLDANGQQKPLPAHITKPTTFCGQAIAEIGGDTVMIYTGDYIYRTYNNQVVDSTLVPAEFQRIGSLSYTYRNGLFYFITQAGLQQWNPENNKVQLLNEDLKSCVSLTFKGDQLFALHADYGLRIYEPGYPSWRLVQELYPSDHCNSYFLDNEGNLWLTTLGDGVYFYPRQTVASYATALPAGQCRLTSLLLNNDQLYLGTYHGNIYTFDPEERSTSLMAESHLEDKADINRVMSMVSLSTGEVLVGKDNGIYLLRENSLRKLVKSTVKSLCVDDQDNLVVNTQNSCFKVSREVLDKWYIHPVDSNKNVLSQVEVISNDRGYSSFVSSDGTIWTDNTTRGFMSYRDGRVTFWADYSQIFKVHVNDIEELIDGTLAIATQGEGIIFLKNGDFWVVDELLQLPSNIVNNLYVSGGQLWAATNRGVALISDVNVSRRQVSINVYNRNDGLLTDDITDLVVWQDELLLATENGLLGLPLSKEEEKEVSPRVLIQSLKVDGMDLTLGKNIELPNHLNNPRFSFLGISFRSQGKIRYRYRLEGYDQDWLSTANREVNYHNLSPGTYTFMVQAIDYKGHFSRETAKLTFYVRPHFTQRLSFWLFLMVVVIGLLGAIGYSYVTVRERNVLSLLVQEKTADLDQQVAELARSNEELEQFARAASHDLKSPLRNVASFVQLLNRRASDRLTVDEKEYIQLAVNGVKSMERTIEDLLRVTKIDQQDTEKVPLNFLTVIKEIEQANQHLLEEQQAKIIIDTEFPELTFSQVNAYQLFQNLIINSINYRAADAPRIHVGCEVNGAFWQFYVKDNGIGIEKEFQEQIFGLFQRLHRNDEIPGTGIGLAICKKIVERNGGKISLDSTPGQGTTFYFTIPKD